MPEDIFVGRTDIINKQFKTLLTSPAGPFVLNLRGPGGIGKTKILQEIEKICNDPDNPIRNTGIIDFYGSDLRSQINAVELEIANRLWESMPGKPDPFAEYRQVRKKAEDTKTGQDPASYGPFRELSREQFIEDLKNCAEDNAIFGNKIVLIFDTFEAVKGNQVGARLLREWLPVLTSAIVVLSGRQQAGEIDALLPSELVSPVEDSPVGEFTWEEAKDYLDKRDVLHEIQDAGVLDDLFRLTQRRPLLLALSADRLTKFNIPEQKITAAELVNVMEPDEFERKLVQGLSTIRPDERKPEPLVLPEMAHIPRPFDEELIRVIFEGLDAQKVLKNLSRFSFIKEIKEHGVPRYWFQDELRRLFHKHVFTMPGYNRKREEASKTMLKFYKQKIEAATDIREREQLEADQWYHIIYLDRNKFEEARVTFQNLREAHQIRFAGMLLATLRTADEAELLDEEQQFSLQLMEARSLRDNGYVDLSKNRFEVMLSEHTGRNDRIVYIHNSLAESLQQLGDFRGALKNYQESLRLSEELGLSLRFWREHRNIGRVVYKLGQWRKAAERFEKAYELALEAFEQIGFDEQARKQTQAPGIADIAEILSDLGRVYGLLGEHQEGIDYINLALKLWDSPQRVSQGLIRRGTVYRFAGNYEKSLQDLEQSLEHLPEARIWAARANFQLGLTKWFSVNQDRNIDDPFFDILNAVQRFEPGVESPTAKREEVEEALKNFETCVNIARDYKLDSELPGVLNETGRLYWCLGNKVKARQLNREAREIAEKNHDAYYIINSLVACAEFDFNEGNYSEIPTYFGEIKSRFEDEGYDFVLLFGRMRRILGNMAFAQKKYDEAADYYADALQMIARHSSKWRMRVELENLERNVSCLSKIDQLRLYARIKTRWATSGSGNSLRLRGWVNRQIISVRLA